MKTREQKRNERAEAVCRELRYQMANRRYNEQELFTLLEKWMKVAKGNKYVRPSIRRGL